MSNDETFPMLRRPIALVIVLIVALTQVACGSDNGDSESSKRTDGLRIRLETPVPNDVIVIAHRTCWQNTAENSITGIEECIKLGVDMIEIDVRETSDGELVLMHDDTIDRTTNGTGPLSDLTLEDVRELRLRIAEGGDTAALSDERIPTLYEALSASSGRILVNLDIKEALYDRALAIAKEIGSHRQILIKMRAPANDPALVNAAFHGQTYFMPIIRECTEDPARACTESLAEAIPTYARHNPIAVEVVNHSDKYLLEGIPVAQGLGWRVWVNTLGPRFAAGRSDDKSLTDPDNNWGFLIDHGVNMIQTDRPEELIQYLESRNARESAR